MRQVKGDKVVYIYADPTICSCLYVGGQKSYGTYRPAAFDKQDRRRAGPGRRPTCRWTAGIGVRGPSAIRWAFRYYLDVELLSLIGRERVGEALRLLDQGGIRGRFRATRVLQQRT